ncbi:hypothetical protein [Microbacterium sp. 5K110]|uniref:hypothetical protein n=1 Tax=unclassified Microbacterium TaxID=2609290 RepID=UPI0010FE6894|nr:hypothetical protein [Microbacterium sp. 5K110]TLF29552.1 hypothetical protein FE256_12530 [Microbacterium sp. 5K110]
MTRRPASLAAVLGVGLLAAGLLTGCASGAASSPETKPPVDATTPAPSTDVSAGWLDAGRGIAVVTRGSSSCVPVASGDAVLASDTLTIELVDRENGPCTRDFAPRATYVALPAGIDPTRPLDVVVTGAVEGTASVSALATPPAAVTEFAPSAGWVGDGLAAILTWGSSTCRPQVEAVTSVEGGAAVTFAEPPADQVCTADMAPRVSLADLTGIAGEDPVELTLSGGNIASDGPIPVLGQG